MIKRTDISAICLSGNIPAKQSSDAGTGFPVLAVCLINNRSRLHVDGVRVAAVSRNTSQLAHEF